MKKMLYVFVLLNLLMISAFGQTIKVDDFGAVGDGVTDDRAAIQSAFDALRTNGGEVQFTSGKTYIIKAGLKLYFFSANKNYLITTTGSEKATIKIADGTPITYGHWGIYLSSSRNITISNLHMDGNRDTRNPTVQVAGTYLIEVFDRCDGLRLNDLILENSVIDNLMITASNEDDSTTFLSDFEMHNCILRNGWRNNLSVIRGKNFKIIGCEFNNAHGLGDPEAGIDFEPDHTTNGSVLGYRDILIEGCIFRNNKRFGITLCKHNDIEIEGRVTIRNNYFENNGIYILSWDNVITNNVFRKVDHKPIVNMIGTEEDGIIVFSPWYSDYTKGNKIYNNYFYDNPLPDEQHLIGLSSNTDATNEIYSNYSNNNNIDGFVLNPSSSEQIIYDNVELTRKEVGYWNMDSDSISGTSIFDLSDFRQTGELRNNPVIVNGWYNEALDFSPDNKNIDIPIKEILNMKVNLTISAWVNWNGTSSESEQVIVGKDGDWHFGLDNSGKLGFHGESKNGTTYTGGLTESSEPLPTSLWTHVAVTYNGRATTIYINGVNSGSKESIGNLSTSSLKISIGSLLGETSSFNGSIDDVKIFNYGLSGSEIDSLYRIASGHNKTKPVGLGTEVSPYEINSLVNLSWLTQTPEAWNAYYIQTADIDASKTSMWDDSDDNGDGDKYNDINDKTTEGNNEGWLPIGSSSEKFTGHYNGDGHTIKYLTIKHRSTSGNGFFGVIGGGVVENLGLTKVDIEGSDRVGGLVALCDNNSISNSYVTGEIKCVDGGTVGYHFGGLVGIAGEGSPTTISFCYNESNISGSVNTKRVGGLVGSLTSGSTVSESYSLGNIISIGDFGGGLVGELSSSTIKNSYSFGSVLRATGSSETNIGGFVGGVTEGSIENSYSIGLVDNSFTDHGFVGAASSESPTFSNNFFDQGTSGQSSSLGAEGKSSVAMMDAATFASWDMTTIWKVNGNYPNLRANSNKDLEHGGIPGEIPNFKGNGTEEDPYQVATLSNLSWVSQNSSMWSSYFIQTSDLDASITATWDDSDDNNDGNKYNDPNDLTMDGSNDGFSPIGNKGVNFTGVYDGQGYGISNITINRPTSKYVGLFGTIKGVVEKESLVKDLSLKNVTVTGSGYVGGFVGKNLSGRFSHCSSEGKVSSNSTTGYIGGFVGYNAGPESRISNCYSNVEVVSSGSGKYIGGFVGRNRSYAEIDKSYSLGTVSSEGDKVGGFLGHIALGKISNCYSMGSITSSSSASSVGGFCGAIYEGTLEYCYSVGANLSHKTKGFLGSEGGSGNVYLNNYLDTLASGCNQSALEIAASGKTTSEMKNKSTYTGWDFINTWVIDGDNYPMLKEILVSVKEDKMVEMPSEYLLEQNYPNPFNPTTVIRFAIPKQSHVKLSVYNIIGEQVSELVNGNLSSGYHEVNFNASNLASGMYIYRISVGSYVEVKKMLLLK